MMSNVFLKSYHNKISNAFKIRIFIKKENMKWKYYDLFILPSQSLVLTEFISWFY